MSVLKNLKHLKTLTNNLHNFKKLIKTFKLSDFNKELTSSLKMI